MSETATPNDEQPKPTGIYPYQKLVRDGIPEEVAANGHRAAFRTLGAEELIAELRRKLVEEVYEYLEDLSVGELADVRDVLDALIEQTGREAVEAASARKFAARGGFSRGLFMIWAERR